jgi:selenocysteine lyase/cysteine desulfurase
MLQKATKDLLEITAQHEIYGSEELRAPQMASLMLPQGDFANLHAQLFDEYQVEIPVFATSYGNLFRVSLQAYNTEDDVLRLCSALKDLL